MNPEMLPIFVAQGPSFQRKLQVRQFHNIELYNLMCVMLDIQPANNNGTWVSTPRSTPQTFNFQLRKTCFYLINRVLYTTCWFRLHPTHQQIPFHQLPF